VKPYEARFPVGTHVQIADAQKLDDFMREWKYHNPLKTEQIDFAGRPAVVEKVGFYHGGDPLYVLRDIPGLWHEECLEEE